MNPLIYDNRLFRKTARRMYVVICDAERYMKENCRKASDFEVLVCFCRICHKWAEVLGLELLRDWLDAAPMDCWNIELYNLAHELHGMDNVRDVANQVVYRAPLLMRQVKQYLRKCRANLHKSHPLIQNHLYKLRGIYKISEHHYDLYEVPIFEAFKIRVGSEVKYGPLPDGKSCDLALYAGAELERMYLGLLKKMQPQAEMAFFQADCQARLDANCALVKTVYEKGINHA